MGKKNKHKNRGNLIQNKEEQVVNFSNQVNRDRNDRMQNTTSSVPDKNVIPKRSNRSMDA